MRLLVAAKGCLLLELQLWKHRHDLVSNTRPAGFVGGVWARCTAVHPQAMSNTQPPRRHFRK